MRLNIKHTIMIVGSAAVITYLGPKVFSGEFPKLTAYLEAFTNLDISRRGRCRLDNTQTILKMGTGKLVSGFVTMRNGVKFGHLWGVGKDGEIVDCACPETNPDCRNRTAVAEYNPFLPGVPLTNLRATTTAEKQWAQWGQTYLETYVPIATRK